MYRLKRIYNLERNEEQSLKGASYNNNRYNFPANFKLKFKKSTFFENHIKPIIKINDREKEQMKTHVQDRIPIGYNQCLLGINEVLKHAWDIATKKDLDDEKTRLQALTLANECYKHKMDLITNGVVIDDALKFVSANKNNKVLANKKPLNIDNIIP